MMQAFVLALLLLSNEQSYGPYARPDRGGLHGVATGSHGVLLAWSENVAGSRIRAGLLDFRGRLISPISVLPASTETAEAYAPAVSFNGESFLVTWVERDRGRELVRGMLVDDLGTPFGAAHTYDSTVAFPAELPTPSVVWDGNGAQWRMKVDARTFRVFPSGDGFKDGSALPLAQAVAIEEGVLGTASSKMTPIWKDCFLFRCRRVGDAWDIVWTDGEESGTKPIGGDWLVGTVPVSSPAIAATGGEFAVAWSSVLGVGYLLTHPVPNAMTVAADPKIDMAPGLACDDERCVIAYGTAGGDVHGVVFEPARHRSPEQFTIATTERTEHSPQVHSLGGGRFLVSYSSDQGSDRRLNGRVVGLEPMRRRAVH